MLLNMAFLKKDVGYLFFAYHNTTNYFKEMKKYSPNDIIFSKGFFAETFPIESESSDNGKSNISRKFKDIVDVSDNFNFHFFNSGVMLNGNIKTHKVRPIVIKKPLLVK